MAFDRDDHDSIAQALEDFIPDEATRRFCLNFLADSIDYASGCAGDRWGLTLKPNFVRLNVGKIEVLTISYNVVHCLLDLNTVPKELWDDERLDIKGNKQDLRMGVYSSVPGSVFCNVPAEEFDQVSSSIRPSHRVLIDNASRTGRNPMTKKGHSPASIDYLSSYLGRALSQPLY
jgi:hypothetical protein